jgi:hypothetical protein
MTAPDEEKLSKVKSTIMRLSQLCDLIALREQILSKTKYGKRPGSEPWTHSKAFLGYYAEALDPEEVIQLFESVGAHSDIEAVRFLLKHDELVP